MDVKRAHELTDQGQTRSQLARSAARGDLIRVRHGAYATACGASAVERHLQLLAGTWPTLGPNVVLSHVSAGLLHGLPSWAGLLGRVTVIRSQAGHGERRSHLHARQAGLLEAEVVQLKGFRATSLERTAIDLACLLGFEQAVALLDAANHAGADETVLARTLSEAKRRHGIGTARSALAFADGRSESPAESISRVRMAEVALPEPELQINVFDEHGVWVARSDFGWLDRGVPGEFDGRVKYTGPQDEVARAVMREKEREAAIRRLGWVVVRWGWDELADRAAFRARIEAGFEQASNRIRGHAEVTARHSEHSHQ